MGTGATAPPGALTQTPRSPSAVGPRLDLQSYLHQSCNDNDAKKGNEIKTRGYKKSSN